MLNLPDLVESRVYRYDEIRQFIVHEDGSSDYHRAWVTFPRTLDDKWEPAKAFAPFVGPPGAPLWRDEDMLLQYRLLDMTYVRDQLDERERQFAPLDDHCRRIRIIEELLTAGGTVCPVFIQKNDPRWRVCEGMHRSLAIRRLGSRHLPTWLMGYRDWF